MGVSEDRRTRTAAAVVALGAVLVLAGVLTRHWWSSREGDEMRVGLLDVWVCDASGCWTASFDEMLGRGNGAFRAFATVTLVSGLAAALALLGCAAHVVAGRVPRWPVAPTTIAVLACAVALISAFMVMMFKPEQFHAQELGTGPSFPLAGAGMTLGLAGSILLARAWVPSHDPYWDNPEPDEPEEQLPPLQDS